MLVQLPVLIVMYQVIRGLTQVRPGGCEGFDPKYLDQGSELFKDLCASRQEMVSFGIDLSKTASDAFNRSLAAGLPFLLLVGLVILVQYYQSKQMTRRSAAPPSPQMQMMIRVMPVMFGVFSFAFPAGLNVYFIISGLFRVAQQGAMYRWDPTLAAHAEERAKEKEAQAKAKEGSGKTQGKGAQSKRPTAKAQAKGGAKNGQDKRGAKGGQGKRSGKKPATGRADGSKPEAKGARSGPKGNADGRRSKSTQKGKGGHRGRARKRRAKRGR